MLSNLIVNAVTHDGDDRPVRINATVKEGQFELSVVSHGQPIPAAMQADLFKPFFRGARSDPQGLGLGLYISAEIARAHQGALTVTSSPAETRFTFRMPAHCSRALPAVRVW